MMIVNLTCRLMSILMTIAILAILVPDSSKAQSKPTRDWLPATVGEVTYGDEEKVIPRSHMVKRQGCQGGR